MTDIVPLRSRDPDLDRLWNEFLQRREALYSPAATILDGIALAKALGAFLAAAADRERRTGV